MKQCRNPFEVLGITPDAPDYVVQAAYRACLKKFHPDKYHGKDAAERTSEIVEAYEAIKSGIGERAKDQPNQEKSSGPPSPPPPPPAPPPESDKGEDEAEEPPEWRTPLVTLGIMIFGGLAFMIANDKTSRDREYAGMAVDAAMMDAEANLDAMAVGVDDVLFDAEQAAIDAELAMAGASALDPEVWNVETTAYLPAVPDAVDFANIEEAVVTMQRTLRRSGIAGARKYSENCHVAAADAQEWGKLDFCAAFDYAAAEADRGAARAAGRSQSSYFAFQVANQADHYGRPGQTNTRLRTIRNTTQGVLRDLGGGGRGSDVQQVEDLKSAMESPRQRPGPVARESVTDAPSAQRTPAAQPTRSVETNEPSPNTDAQSATPD
ncbi:DnaJ domain-containing protein [Qipengyuania sp. DSG2-2]|uniref:J domain-containing protein n=1 Tax=Qipengyuania sp. DGS2-2 TaxID=3349631 RepID=UPI0036D36893